MALNLPAIPKIAASKFSLTRLTARNPVRDGGHQAVEMGEPIWVAEFSTTPLSAAQAGEYDALAAKLRGGARTLYVHDASRPRPLAYAASAPSDWLASSTTVLASSVAALASGVVANWGGPQVIDYDRTGGRIKLSELTAGATLSPGDPAAWDDGPARRYVRVVETAVADAAGEAWVFVEPAPPASTANLPAACALEKPCAEMIVLDFANSFSVAARWQASVQAVQLIRRV